MNILSDIQRCAEHLTPVLVRYLPHPSDTPALHAAMHYACLNGGKRLRPFLAYMTGQLFGARWETIDPLAAALEFVHCYSLIHDDLPAMDNDDFRRGKPTCHKVYGEATAILAGDALLTLAFELLSQDDLFIQLASSNRLQLIKVLAQASGMRGMVKGQAIDLDAQGKSLSLDDLVQMHRAKTGALIAASVQCGALASGCASGNDLLDLQKYGEAIGLAFQIQDDILDCLGSKETMGKNPGQDVINQKCTFVTQLGLEQAKIKAQDLHQQALNALTRFGSAADPLRHLSGYIIERVA